MAEADPLAEVLVDVACPACGVEFVADVDVAGFVWAELRAHARGGSCARWTRWPAPTAGPRPEVLSLGERRRAAYLELALEGRA